MSQLTPREIVSELDKYIIGQAKAKKAVAIAIRNRWRRQQVVSDLKEEIYPKNIIMIGSTGVGKTEIARRLARLVDAPFLKVEATKYTEVGYVGKDVESMIRDLVEISVKGVKEKAIAEVSVKAREMAEQRVVDLLLKQGRAGRGQEGVSQAERDTLYQERENERRLLFDRLRTGELHQQMLEIEASQRVLPMVEILAPVGLGEMDSQLREMMSQFMPKRMKHKRMTVAHALEMLQQEEADKLIDMEQVISEGLEKAENNGIIFFDEIDKVAGKTSRHGPDVSREGVQRDILPIVEGTSVGTKYGVVKTDHILFIAAGAFHMSKPSDLIPELQGRFPIRVELDSLTERDFIRNLTEPRNALTKQYVELLRTEHCELIFTSDAVEEISRIASEVNARTENIGARRLATIMEYLLEDISFTAPDRSEKRVEKIDRRFVSEKLKEIVASEDLSRYIL
ncbi:MAG: ATP-dependent protease ATPase subunit HslU [Deltaproteobacteria bacterium]|nr:ATP-dependent protease ATPase subunit HslU [Deltaproteobacteria bacterium]